ncbi:hypothetical protein E4U23_002529 [Claviceps purpurea]|nr:hypothetical protein E4U23_002529 [Claviceps purpurea]
MAAHIINQKHVIVSLNLTDAGGQRFSSNVSFDTSVFFMPPANSGGENGLGVSAREKEDLLVRTGWFRRHSLRLFREMNPSVVQNQPSEEMKSLTSLESISRNSPAGSGPRLDSSPGIVAGNIVPRRITKQASKRPVEHAEIVNKFWRFIRRVFQPSVPGNQELNGAFAAVSSVWNIPVQPGGIVLACNGVYFLSCRMSIHLEAQMELNWSVVEVDDTAKRDMMLGTAISFVASNNLTFSYDDAIEKSAATTARLTADWS